MKGGWIEKVIEGRKEGCDGLFREEGRIEKVIEGKEG